MISYRRLPKIFVGVILGAAIAGCGNTSLPPATVAVFNGEDNRLKVYDPDDPSVKQTFPSNSDAPGVGRDLNGQICFKKDADGVHFVMGEDSNQGREHVTAGWGYFDLSGSKVGEFQYQEVGKFIPTYQFTPDEAENYGCGFLSDGRLVTTDVGNQATGDGNGQLIMWFPPLRTGATYTPTGVVPDRPAHYCKLDIAIGTAGGIYVDSQDRIYVASARVSPAIYRYTGPFPTSDDASGGCGRIDDTGAPLVDSIHKEVFIPTDGNILTPNAVITNNHGGFYVSSVINGVIAEYDADGKFIRRVLEPPAGEVLGPMSFSTGTPLGIGIDSSGNIYYADIGIVIDGSNIGPGDDTGTVRELPFDGGRPGAPITFDRGLNFPDGIGVLELGR